MAPAHKSRSVNDFFELGLVGLALTSPAFTWSALALSGPAQHGLHLIWPGATWLGPVGACSCLVWLGPAGPEHGLVWPGLFWPGLSPTWFGLSFGVGRRQAAGRGRIWRALDKTLPGGLELPT